MTQNGSEVQLSAKEIVELSQAYEQAKAMVSQVNREKEEAAQELSELSLRYQASSKARTAAEQSSTQLETQLQSLQARVILIQEKLNSLSYEKNLLIEKFGKQGTENEEQKYSLVQAEMQMALLKDQLEASTRQAERLEMEKKYCEEELLERELQEKKVSALLEKTEARVVELEQHRDNLSALALTSQEEVGRLGDKVQNLMTEADANKKGQDSMSVDLERAVSKAQELQQEIDVLQNNVNTHLEARKESEFYKAQHKKLELQCLSLRAQLESQMSIEPSAQQKESELAQQANALREELASLKKTFQASEIHHRGTAADLSRRTQDLQILEMEHNDLVQQARQHLEQLNTKHLENMDLEAKLARITEQLQQKQEEASSSNSNTEQRSSVDEASAQAELASLKQHSAVIESTAMELANELNVLTVQLDEVKELSQKEIAFQKSENTELRSKLDTTMKSLIHLKEDHAAVQAQSEQLIADAESSAAKLQTLENRLQASTQVQQGGEGSLVMAGATSETNVFPQKGLSSHLTLVPAPL